MPNLNQSFQGQTLIIPGAYYADNVQAGNPTAPPPAPPLIFIGFGYGGKPQTGYTFADPQDLSNAVRNGPCAPFIPFLTNPSNQVNGAQLVTYINPGENTQSTLALSNAAGSGVMVMTSANYGTPSNLLQASVTTGSIAGKKLTLFDGFASTSAVGDNLGVPFQVAYTGAATGGLSYTVAVSGLNALSFHGVSPNPNESFTVSFASGQYTTVQQLVNYINGTGFWSAIPVGDTSMPTPNLDIATTVSLAAVSGTTFQYSNVTAALGACLWFVNQYVGSTYATAVASGSVTQLTSGLAPANIPLTPFAGAVSIPPTTSDYTTALNVALQLPGWVVFVDSNNAAVQALLAQHCVTASSVSNGKYRRGFTGSSLGDSVNTTIAAAQSLNALQMCYVYPGIFRTSTTTGINTLYSGLYAAAACAGIAAGNQIALPLTNKSLVGNGVEVQLTTSQINQLQQTGVIPLWVPTQTSVPTIISDQTTWQNDSNVENCLTQQVACRFYTAYSLVNAMAPYVGQIADPTMIVRIRNAVSATLNALIYTPGSNGTLASWNPNSLILVYNGTTQTLGIQVSVTLVGQIRFITIYVPIQPLSLTLSAQSLVLAA